VAANNGSLDNKVDNELCIFLLNFSAQGFDSDSHDVSPDRDY
jgi:hypothetical protein